MTGLRNALHNPIFAALFSLGAAFVLFFCGWTLYTVTGLPVPVIAAILLLPAAILLLDGHPRKAAARRGIHYLMGIFTLPWLYFLLCDGALGVLLLLLRGFSVPLSVSQRARLGILFGLLWLLLLLWGAIGAGRIRKRRLRLALPGQKDPPKKILLLSDLHLGCFTSLRFLRKTVAAAMAEQPELILIAGDLFDFSFSDLRDPGAVAEVLRTLHAPLGVYACAGNHDGVCFAEDGRGKDFLCACGITLLQDEAVLLPGIRLFGRKDAGDATRLQAAKIPSSDGLPLIVLDHRPSDIPALAAAGAAAVFCGHTHGGQTFPGNLLLRMLSRYSVGRRKTGSCFSYTTAGCGRWGLPIRCGVTNELVLLEITHE